MKISTLLFLFMVGGVSSLIFLMISPFISITIILVFIGIIISEILFPCKLPNKKNGCEYNYDMSFFIDKIKNR